MMGVFVWSAGVFLTVIIVYMIQSAICGGALRSNPHLYHL